MGLSLMSCSVIEFRSIGMGCGSWYAWAL